MKNLRSGVSKVITSKKGLGIVKQFNEIQVKAASTITRKAEEAVGVEWNKCRSAIENNFS